MPAPLIAAGGAIAGRLLLRQIMKKAAQHAIKKGAATRLPFAKGIISKWGPEALKADTGWRKAGRLGSSLLLGFNLGDLVGGEEQPRNSNIQLNYQPPEYNILGPDGSSGQQQFSPEQMQILQQLLMSQMQGGNNAY